MNIEKVKEHYDHAREKHPYFCDNTIDARTPKESYVALVSTTLNLLRDRIKSKIADGSLDWYTLLECEVFEAIDAIINGGIANAVEECYDAIAVLLRVVDVLEGRQELGNPNKEKTTHE